ncbi:MAG: CinA family protein [Chloroflexi bacterium]|nr:CinA family protein [Chloroflexota bacterium]
MAGYAGLEWEIGELLRRHKLSLATAESATGGLISHLITNVPGSSDYFKGSVTAYSNEAKVRLLGVAGETIRRYGAVSAQVAEAMAAGGRRALDADICISDTGVAGPGGGTADKPVGLFYLGLAHQGGASSRRHVFRGDREENKQGAARAALGWLKEYLEGL